MMVGRISSHKWPILHLTTALLIDISSIVPTIIADIYVVTQWYLVFTYVAREKELILEVGRDRN